jgi:mono/diheme cytochrome c family protein
MAKAAAGVSRNHRALFAAKGGSIMTGRHAVFALTIFSAFTLLVPGISTAAGGAGKSGAAQVPAFADRAKIPADGKQGPPGKAATLNGSWKRGKALFEKNCQTCHGPQGTDKVQNPGSDDGTVPPLNPIDPELAGKTPSAFAAKIDRYIQHGSIPDGPNPALFMPNWGDSKTLSQKEIADVEAYVMRLNGVSGKK